MAVIDLTTGSVGASETMGPVRRVIDLETGAFKTTGEQDDVDIGIDSNGALPLDSLGDVGQGLRGAAIKQGIDPSGGPQDDQVAGILQPAARVVTGAIAEPLAGLAGLASAPFVGAEKAAENIASVRNALTFDVTSEIGQSNLRAVAGLLDKGVEASSIPAIFAAGELLTGQGPEQAVQTFVDVGEKGVSETLGQRVFEETESPVLAAVAQSLPTAALEAVGVKGLKTVKAIPVKGGKLSSNVAEAITQAAPDIKTIKTRATAAYNELDKLGVKVKPAAYESFANKLSARLKKEGLDPTLHPKTTAALKRITDDIGQAKTATELETLRKIAKGAASSIEPPDARLGGMIVRGIDDGLDSLSEQIGGKFKEARALSQRAFKSQAITDMIEDASHTASGMENGLRIEARKLLKNKKRRRGFTNDELAALRQIEQGTTAANMTKFLGKFGISEGQATSMLGASIGIGGGGAIGAAFGPGGAAIGAVTVPALGQIAKKTAQRITLRNTKFADDLVRAGKDAKSITRAYLKHTPIANRNVSDLTDLLIETNLKPGDIRGLPGSASPARKLFADAAFFANAIKRRVGQAASVTVIASPPLDEPGDQ